MSLANPLRLLLLALLLCISSILLLSLSQCILDTGGPCDDIGDPLHKVLVAGPCWTAICLNLWPFGMLCDERCYIGSFDVVDKGLLQMALPVTGLCFLEECCGCS